MVDEYKIHMIVEYVRALGFEFETDEVIESLDGILAFYNVLDYISDDEYYCTMDELLPLAEEFEFSEAAYMASQEDPLLAQIKERDLNLWFEAIESKLRRAHSNHDVSDLSHKLTVA